MKKTLVVFMGILVLIMVGTSMAWAVPAVAPKIGVAMTSAGGTQTTLEISVKPPNGSQTYTYSYSVDGGANWAAGGSLVLNNGLYTASWVADNYSNVLIRVTAQADDAKTSYTMAYPPNPSGHSNYSTNTNVCKNCHTTHTAVGKKLLAQSNIENLCTSCHGSTANGAKYLVVAGKQVVSVTGQVYNLADSLGGGFPDAANSRHSYKESETAAFPPGGKPDSSIKMDCVKCHQGHAANNALNYNYRILKTSVSENTYAYDTTVVGIFAYAQPGLGDVYKTLPSATAWTPLASGISNFCGSCHNDFNVVGTGGSGPANTIFSKNQDNVTGKTIFQPQYYRHPIDVPLDTLTGVYGIDTGAVTLPLFSSKINCLTCHKAHGSSTTQDNDPNARNYLLRLNNRAVCENCHQK